MALVVFDRVKETSNTAGTGTIVLAGAVAGYQSFAVVGNANTTYYTIADQVGSNWEVGIGTYYSGNVSLSRTTILASSNANTAVTFGSNTKDVFLTYPAEKSVYANNSPDTATYVLTANGVGVPPTWQAAGMQTVTTTDFTATSGQTVFTVSYTVGLVSVYRNGIKLGNADYTATNGTSITLATGAITGDLIEVQAFSGLNLSTVVNSFSTGTTGLTASSSTGAVSLAGTLAVANGGTGVTTSTGSGNVVLSTSPTLVTPALGTPSSVNLSNATSLAVAALPAGSVIQVVHSSTGTQVTTSGGTPVSIGLAASITPQFSTSKILIITTVNGIFINAVASGFATNQLYRGGSSIGSFGYILGYMDGTPSTTTNRAASNSFTYLDSPATTSSTTYTVYGNAINGTTINFQRDSQAISSITLMEIKQ